MTVIGVVLAAVLVALCVPAARDGLSMSWRPGRAFMLPGLLLVIVGSPLALVGPSSAGRIALGIVLIACGFVLFVVGEILQH